MVNGAVKDVELQEHVLHHNDQTLTYKMLIFSAFTVSVNPI